MKAFKGAFLAAGVCVVLGACHFPGSGPKQPTGQVVATVGDREITQRELSAELGGATFPDPKTRKAAEQLALENIIARVVLANAAHDQGLDKSPDFAVQKQRAIDGALAQALQQKVIADVPQPSKDEVQSFINAHPDIFLERKIYAVDQIRMARSTDPKVIKALEPLKTLEQVEDVLKANNVRYQRGSGNLDAVGTDPRLIEKISQLPAGEIFIFPSGELLLANQIKSSTVAPFTGDAANAYAQKVMMRQRTQDVLSKTFRDLMAKAMPKVRFSKDFKPPKPAAAAASPASPAASPATNSAAP